MSTEDYEGIGHGAALQCANAVLNFQTQAVACNALTTLLNKLSGDGEIAVSARLGAAVALAPILLAGVRALPKVRDEE